MNRHRRRIIKGALLASAAYAAAGLPQASGAPAGTRKAATPLKLLILGGTGFIASAPIVDPVVVSGLRLI